MREVEIGEPYGLWDRIADGRIRGENYPAALAEQKADNYERYGEPMLGAQLRKYFRHGPFSLIYGERGPSIANLRKYDSLEPRHLCGVLRPESHEQESEQ
jgi:hypothetical protein